MYSHHTLYIYILCAAEKFIGRKGILSRMRAVEPYYIICTAAETYAYYNIY